MNAIVARMIASRWEDFYTKQKRILVGNFELDP